MIYLDTSAFLKLYVKEAGSDLVQDQVFSQDEALPLWDLLHAELINAIRLKSFWGELDKDKGSILIGLIDRRLQTGQYFAPNIDRSDLHNRFRRLSEHTADLGCRTMDVLHVACALQLSSDRFISFDERQRNLARQAGLSVAPGDLP